MLRRRSKDKFIVGVPYHAPAHESHLESMMDASEAATVIMALKLELAELRTSLDVSLQTERDLSSANDSLSSSLSTISAERDHLRSSLEQTRNVVACMQRSARKASAERAELRVQAEMLRNENDRFRGYAKMRVECDKLRMENQRLREQLAQAQAQAQAQEMAQAQQSKQTAEQRVPSSLYSLTSVGVPALSIFSQQPGSASGVNTLPERQQNAPSSSLPVCTNEPPKRAPPGVLHNQQVEERLSSLPMPRRTSLLNMLSGFKIQESSEGNPHKAASHNECFPKIKPAGNGKSKQGFKATSSMFSAGQWKSCPARLQQDAEGGKQGVGGRRRRNGGGRGSIKVLADRAMVLADQVAAPHQDCDNDREEGSMRRTWSGSKLGTVDLQQELYDDDDSGDDSLASDIPGGILVPWRHELVERRGSSVNNRNSETGRQKRCVQQGRKQERHEQEPAASEQAKNAEVPAPISAMDAARVMCSADIFRLAATFPEKMQPQEVPQVPPPEEKQSEQQQQQLLHDDDDDDRRDNLTVGTADDVERFFSDMLDADLDEEEILRDLGEMTAAL